LSQSDGVEMAEPDEAERLHRPLARWAVAALAAVALVGVGFLVGRAGGDQSATAGGEAPTTSVSTPGTGSGPLPVERCAGLQNLVDDLTTGVVDSQSIATIEALGRSLPPGYGDDVDTLLSVYRGLDEGDIGLLNDRAQMSRAEQAADHISRFLIDDCGVRVTGPTTG